MLFLNFILIYILVSFFTPLDKKGKEQNSSGIYCERLINTPKIDSQEYFYQEAYKKENNM